MASLRDLYELVAVLKKNEKKHVSLVMKALGAKASERYLYAFKTLSTQKEFNEEKLKKKLSLGFKGMNLSEANNNVYDFIGEALLSYKNLSISPYTKQLALIEFYVQRKLYKKSHQLLQNLLPELQQGTSYGLLQRAEELQEIITIHYRPVQNNKAFRLQFFEDRKETIKLSSLNLEMLKLKFEFFDLTKNIGTPRNSEQLAHYQALWKRDIIHVSSSEIPIKFLFSYFQLRGGISAAMLKPNAFEEIKANLKEYLKRTEENPRFLRAEYSLIDLFISAVGSKSTIEKEDLEYVIARLEVIINHIKQPMFEHLANCKINILYMLYYLKSEKYEEAINFYEDQLTKEEKWRSAPLSYMVIIFGAIAYFLNDETDKCLDNLILIADDEKKIAPSLLVIFHFVKLMAHYKLGHHLFLESATRSLKRSLKTSTIIYAPEKSLLNFLRHGNDINRMEENFQKLHDNLEDLAKDEFHREMITLGFYLPMVNKLRKK